MKVAVETELRRRAECFDGLLAALKTANTAMDDWLNTYAPEMCNEKRVAEAWARIAESGTIAYIAEVQEKILAAIAKAEGKS